MFGCLENGNLQIVAGDAKSWLLNFWPTTIVKARYGGIYEGGQWVALPLEYDVVPGPVSGGDGECEHWFLMNAGSIGAGESPGAAFDRLVSAMRTKAQP